jgi:3-hydroxyacyl-[acyl-carrier-protein] dehydratase
MFFDSNSTEGSLEEVDGPSRRGAERATGRREGAGDAHQREIMNDTAKPIMTVQQIEKLLPHRYPFLLVDRIVEFEANKRVVGVKCVTANEQFFTGHFPGHPVMPGVLILEALAQCSALMALGSVEPEKRSNGIIYFMAIDGARFRKPVVPGDRLELHCEMIRNKGSLVKTKGQAKVDGQVVAEGEFLAMMVDKDKGGEA